MKILFVNRAAAPVGGGMNQYVIDVASRLRAAGDTVALVHGREPASQFRGTGYVFDHLDRFGAPEHDVRNRLDALVEDFGPDLIQIHGAGNVTLHGWLATHAPTVRFVHSHHGYCSGGRMTWALPRKLCERPHERACLVRHVLCGCGTANVFANLRRYREVSAELKALRRLAGIQVASPVIRDSLVRNGINPERVRLFPLFAPPPQTARRKHATGRRMILHVGGMLRRKGVWLLIRGLKSLPEDVELVFAGGGDQQADVEEHVRRAGLGERVRLMGELSPEQWSALFHQATLVVMPSRWNEPLGLPGIQAMAHAKPVVAFRCQGVAQWLRDGENGALVDFNNAGAFLHAVNELLAQPARLAEMGRNGLEIWRREFRPEAHVEKLREYYASVVARNERR